MKKIILFIVLFFIIFIFNMYSQVNVTFDSLTEMTTNRYGMGYTFDGTYIYAFTGGKNIPPFNSSSMEIYDITNNTWTEIQNDLIPRRYGSAEYISSQNKIYIFNGWYYGSNPSIVRTDTIEIYDVTNGALSYSTSNPYPVNYAGSAVWNDKIYIFGGGTDTGTSNRLYEYDPSTDQWLRLPDMPESKTTGGRIVDGVLYVFGGYTGTTSTRIDAYDIQDSSWTFIANMPVGVSSHASAVSGKYIWLVGSYDNLQLLAIFDTETNIFSQLSNNMTGRRHAAAVVVDTNLYIYGGSQTSSSTSALKSLEYANISNYLVSIPDNKFEIPLGFNLFQNFPNPFNPKTHIRFSLPKAIQVKIKVYNMLGQNVAELLNEFRNTGHHKVIFDGSYFSSGIYFYKIQAGEYQKVRKMLLVK